MLLHLAAAVVAVHLTAPPHFPPRTLAGVERQTSRILASAGVRLVWTEESTLQVEIADGELTGVKPDAVGFAALSAGGRHAVVSWTAVGRAAAQMDVDPKILLAAAIAHEIGHLLFGPAHTQTGIMSPHLGPREMALAGRSELLFINPPRYR